MENLNFLPTKKHTRNHQKIRKENEDNDDGNCVYVINKFSIQRGQFFHLSLLPPFTYVYKFSYSKCVLFVKMKSGNLCREKSFVE